MTNWSDAKYYNGNVTTQITNNDALPRQRRAAALGQSRLDCQNLQPDGSFFADGTPTNGFNTATGTPTEEAFKDRWERTGANSRNDLYAGNLDWTVTPNFFANVQTGYWATDTANPPDFAGTGIIHTFSGTNCDPLPAAAVRSPRRRNLQQTSGFTDNKSTARGRAGPLRAHARQRELLLVQDRLGR